MVSVHVEKKVLDLFGLYLSNKITDAMQELNKFTEEEVVFSVKFHKYNSCLNAPAAKIIIDFQNAIYRIAAFQLSGKSDARFLTREQRESLEIPFAISEGSTVEQAVELLKKIGDLLKVIPEKQRVPALIAVLLIIFGFMAWDSYLDYNKDDKKAELEHEQKLSNTKLLENVFNKLHQQNSLLAGIIANQEKETLKNLPKVDETVEFQQKVYTSEQLKVVEKKKHPRNNPKKVDVSIIKGVFSINDINIKERYLIVESDISSDPIRIYYPDDLEADMLNTKAHLKEAIDDESKRFYIEASVVEKNKKVDTRTLCVIREHKEKP